MMMMMERALSILLLFLYPSQDLPPGMINLIILSIACILEISANLADLQQA